MPTPRTAGPSTPTAWSTLPIIDYEPAPQPVASRPPACPAPSGAALHRSSHRATHPLRPPAHGPEPAPPREAVVFAEKALRQIIEVIDRRRPVAQLRPLMAPVLIDVVTARAGAPRNGSATLRRVRVRSVDTGTEVAEVAAAEVFASFTRGGRVHAVAARITRQGNGWRIAALQIG